MHSFWRLGSGARCDSPLYSTRLARRFVRLSIGTHSADAIGRPAMQRRPPSAATVIVIVVVVVVAVVWSVMVGTPSFARSFVLSIVPVRPGPSIVGVQLLLCLCLCLCCPSWLCWLLVLMFCSGAFNVSSALVASTPQRNILARGTQQTQHSTRQTLSNRESRIATRNSRLSTVNRGKLCVRPFSTLVASRLFVCFALSSHLSSPHLAVAAVFKATCSSSGRRGRNFLHDTCSSSSSSSTKKQSRRIRKLLADFSRCYRVALRRPRRVNKNNKQCAAQLSYSEIERERLSLAVRVTVAVVLYMFFFLCCCLSRVLIVVSYLQAAAC